MRENGCWKTESKKKWKELHATSCWIWRALTKVRKVLWALIFYWYVFWVWQMKVTGSAGMRFAQQQRHPNSCICMSVPTCELWVQAPAIVSEVPEGGQLPIYKRLVLSEMPQTIQDTPLPIPGVSYNLLHLEGLLSDKQRITHSTPKWYQMPKCKQLNHAPHW